jgi:1-deoxy-D-xylulose-5-phosphate synthase
VHDVAIQNLPVRFAIDRAGLVGADGATHAGSFDVAYLGCLPNMVIMAASDEVELANMVKTSVEYNQGPIAFRFPRGEGLGLEIPEQLQALEIGKAKIVKKHENSDIVILSLGTRLSEVKIAEEKLSAEGFKISIIDARFAKPLDKELIKDFAKRTKAMITIEEGSIGGFGSFVQQFLTDNDLITDKMKFRSMILPDEFQQHDDPYKMYEYAGLNSANIINVVKKLLQK